MNKIMSRSFNHSLAASALSAIMAVALSLIATGCVKEFNPTSEEDFAGTEWTSRQDGWLTTLVFTGARVTMEAKGLGVNNIPNTAYKLSGIYSYDEAGNVLTISFDRVEYGYPNIQLPSVVEGTLSKGRKLVLWGPTGDSTTFTRRN